MYRITGAGRETLTAIETPPAAGAPPMRRWPWEAEAARRHAAGEAVGALAAGYGVAWTTMRRAIERQGVPVTTGRAPRPQPPWAGEAAARYRAGEPVRRLSAVFGVSGTVMERALAAEGVQLRGQAEAARASARRETPAEAVLAARAAGKTISQIAAGHRMGWSTVKRIVAAAEAARDPAADALALRRRWLGWRDEMLDAALQADAADRERLLAQAARLERAEAALRAVIRIAEAAP